MRLPTLHALLPLLLPLLLVPACKDRALEPESAEEAARLWGKLLCDQREAVVKADIKALKSRQEIALVRSKLVKEDAARTDPLSTFESQLKFIQDHKNEVGTCDIEVAGKKDLEGGKARVEVKVAFRRVKRTGDLALSESSFLLPVEVTRLDEAWFVTGEPANIPGEADLTLFVE